MYRYPEIDPDVLNPKEVYEVKLLMAYFLNQTDIPCTYPQLLEIFTGEGVVDYFLFTESLKEMLDSGMLERIQSDGVEKYVLSEKGKAGADSFKTLVNKSVRDRILASGMRLFARLKNEQTVSTSIQQLDKGCAVGCTVLDSGTELMSLKLFAPDREQAEHIRRKLAANPDELYGRILNYVMCVEETDPGF